MKRKSSIFDALSASGVGASPYDKKYKNRLGVADRN